LLFLLLRSRKFKQRPRQRVDGLSSFAKPIASPRHDGMLTRQAVRIPDYIIVTRQTPRRCGHFAMMGFAES
jgi:hypothetical protein